MKLYTEEKKYSREGNSFDYKYSIFINLCEKVELPCDIYLKAFSTILKGVMLKYYYIIYKPNPRMTQLVDLCNSIYNTFKEAEFKRSILMKWNVLLLHQVIEKNSDKDIEIYLQILIKELCTTQMTLNTNLQDDLFLQNKFLMACQDYPAYSIACLIPAITSTGLISNLQMSKVTYKSINKKQQSQYLQGDKYNK